MAACIVPFWRCTPRLYIPQMGDIGQILGPFDGFAGDKLGNFEKNRSFRRVFAGHDHEDANGMKVDSCCACSRSCEVHPALS